MAYAVVADVQARIATQLLTITATSQPSSAQVGEWLDQQSAWIDATLRWRYAVPITNATDVDMLQPICAGLVAAMVYQVVGSHSAEGLEIARQLRRDALEMLGYAMQDGAGRSSITLPNSALSSSGEAAVGQPVSSFTDPDVSDNLPRFFEIDAEW